MKGVYDASFVGESQHTTAIHIVSGADTLVFKSQMEKLQSDICAFKEKENLDGHITVIWSTSEEYLVEVDCNSADELLHNSYESSSSGTDISQSILYADAVVLDENQETDRQENILVGRNGGLLSNANLQKNNKAGVKNKGVVLKEI
eukprot:5172286-Ditylum_brightwellii.AAC.1